jgi:hypothetical protein
MDRIQQEQLKEQREAQRLQSELLAAADFKTLLCSAEGRRFLRRVLAECGVHQSSFDTDIMRMSFKEGKRSIGLWLQSLFADCPDQYIQLLTEQSNDTGGS